MGEPAPAVLMPSGDVAIGAPALSELLSVLAAHRELSRDGSAPVPRWTPGLAQVTRVIAAGAVAHQRRRVASVVVPQSQLVARSTALVSSAGDQGSVGKTVSVAVAAQIVGVTTRRIRAMAAAGEITAHRTRCRFPGQRTTRVQWVVDVKACHAHRRERERPG